jgi:hypothetical protein
VAAGVRQTSKRRRGEMIHLPAWFSNRLQLLTP